jgi:DNA-binding NarL/FixJ family response regulator
MIMIDKVPVLLVGDDERSNVGLHVLLCANPETGDITFSKDGGFINAWVQQNPEGLVILDAGILNGNAASLLIEIKQTSAGIRAIVITPTYRQMAMVRKAGADAVLLSGFVADELSQAIHSVIYKS